MAYLDDLKTYELYACHLSQVILYHCNICTVAQKVFGQVAHNENDKYVCII